MIGSFLSFLFWYDKCESKSILRRAPKRKRCSLGTKFVKGQFIAVTVEQSLSVALNNSAWSKTSSKKYKVSREPGRRQKKPTYIILLMTKFSIPLCFLTWVTWFLTYQIQIMSPPIVPQPHTWHLEFTRLYCHIETQKYLTFACDEF